MRAGGGEVDCKPISSTDVQCGETRLTTDALSTAHLLTGPLVEEFGEGQVDLFLCADQAEQLRNISRYGTLQPTEIFEHDTKPVKGHTNIGTGIFARRGKTFSGSDQKPRHTALGTYENLGDDVDLGPQWERLAKCFDAVQRHAAAEGGVTGKYDWVVRSRFDMVFFDKVPPMGHLRRDSVHLPFRKTGGDTSYLGLAPAGSTDRSLWAVSDGTVHSQDTWAYADSPCLNNLTCVYRELGDKPNEFIRDGTGCVLVSDQFAYIPSEHARLYFTGGLVLHSREASTTDVNATMTHGCAVGAAQDEWTQHSGRTV
jgi:hypothetical protein